jgi:hypothetical protein
MGKTNEQIYLWNLSIFIFMNDDLCELITPHCIRLEFHNLLEDLEYNWKIQAKMWDLRHNHSWIFLFTNLNWNPMLLYILESHNLLEHPNIIDNLEHLNLKIQNNNSLQENVVF